MKSVKRLTSRFNAEYPHQAQISLRKRTTCPALRQGSRPRTPTARIPAALSETHLQGLTLWKVPLGVATNPHHEVPQEVPCVFDA